jgi:hypothetical protein
MNIREKAKLITEFCYSEKKNAADFIIIQLIEDLVLPSHVKSYSESFLEECIFKFLKNMGEK